MVSLVCSRDNLSHQDHVASDTSSCIVRVVHTEAGMLSRYLNLLLRYEEIEQDQDEGRLDRLEAESLKQDLDREMDREFEQMINK